MYVFICNMHDIHACSHMCRFFYFFMSIDFFGILGICGFVVLHSWYLWIRGFAFVVFVDSWFCIRGIRGFVVLHSWICGAVFLGLAQLVADRADQYMYIT